MAQLLVRDLSEETVAALKKRAKEHGRSAEAEHRAILEETLAHEKRKREDFWEQADKLRKELEESGRTFTDSTELIRQDRDSR
jgi:plasmid stability protein